MAKDYQQVFALLSYLFRYPDAEWWQHLAEAKQEAETIPSRQNQQVMLEFIEAVQDMGHKEYEELYVRVFEFSQNTNLYLTMHDRTDFGKQAREMIELKSLYLENGFDLDKELPDYLPALLELLSVLNEKQANKVLVSIRPKLELLRTRFLEAKLMQTFLVDVILTEADELKGEETA